MAQNVQDHFGRLPTEVFFMVTEDHGLSIHDLAALAATCRRFYKITNPMLYQKHLREGDGRAINPVLWAVQYKRFTTIRRFLENGADIDSVQISQACMKHEWHFWFGKEMFNPIDDWHPLSLFTPLAFAAMNGLDSMVAFLLDHGADIEKPGKGLCACSTGMNDVAMNLPPHQDIETEGCQETNMDDDSGFVWTPLHIAVCRKHEPTAMLLISRGADLQGTCPCALGPWNALHTATHSGAQFIIDYLLDEKRVDINEKGLWGLTPLHLAYYRKDHALVEKYIDEGADINATWNSGDGGWTIFAMACLWGDLQGASDFLRRGADPDFIIKSGENGMEWTALGLIYADIYRLPECVCARAHQGMSFDAASHRRRLLEEQIFRAKLAKAMHQD
ncbi:hypothetical protein N8I77_003139 [Diaporthe amygdali]|uniref:F-box domain-containing protein n=1 Tax=Phomopsis amygdali TaxID=1214568 RepID=A0AAD9SJK5_PHOAM|nr:hypothetical protein N8I77_003139 [Diaporthe amygdali]